MDNSRLQRFNENLKAEGLDAVALIPGSNLKYLTGFSPMLTKRVALGIFPSSGQPAMVLPSLEAPSAKLHLPKDTKIFVWDDDKGAVAAVEEAFSYFNFGSTINIGVEYAAMRVQDLKVMEQAADNLGKNRNLSDATALMGKQRMVKSAKEIELMQEAARIVEAALEKAMRQIKEGITERELADIVSNEIINAGADGESFEAFAAFGSNTANPHHEPGDRKLKQGELVMIDCGALYKGYASDITRTFALGDPGAKAREIYEVVRQANEAGKNIVKPGVTGEEIDRAARGVIEKAGYGPQFLHRTGHGLGMEIFPVHEYPNLMEGEKEPLPAGTTFTIEPGVYVEGIGGVRIEDDIVVTEDGYKSFTSFPRELIIL